MTRQHINAIAFAVYEVRSWINDHKNYHRTQVEVDAMHNVLDRVAKELARVCARFNSTFNRSSFLKSCGGGGLNNE